VAKLATSKSQLLYSALRINFHFLLEINRLEPFVQLSTVGSVRNAEKINCYSLHWRGIDFATSARGRKEKVREIMD
jgi:hypothetical protein